MLRQGSAALKQMQDEAHKMGAITPQEEIEKAAKLNAELEKRKIALQKIVDTIILKVAPVVEKMLKKFDEWMAADPGRVELVIQGITAALMGLASSEILSGLGAVVNLVKSLALGILNAGPLALMLAGVGTAAIAMYQDFQNYKENGESIIPWDKLIKGAEDAKEMLSGFFDDMKRMWKESPEWLQVLIKGFGEGLVDAIHSAWSAAQELMGGLVLLTDWALTDRTFDGLKERISALHEEAWEWLNPKDPQTKVTVSKPTPITAAVSNYKGYVSEPKPISTIISKGVAEQYSGSFDTIEDSLYNLSNKMPTEVSIKSTSVRSFAEAMQEFNASPAVASTSSITKNADFNGANINIITGATSEDIIDALTAMGGDVNNSFNGTGFIY